MIRIILAFLFFCFVFACKSTKEPTSVKNKAINLSDFRDKYKVIRIDSVKHVFVVYAKKDAGLFKIVSLKDTTPCPRIRIGQEYPFVLMSRVPKQLGNLDISPNIIPHITGIDFYGVSIPFERDSINDIFVALNLRGLCMQ
ncbi:hypothetical protein D3H65_16745 [Paraflavitalea soli]|uniref:Lipoprotein n=1 Tax=Paraflavitalea soli TaxID=2315862 RepID=A0A3B7MV63_9BACT|nr:hypothetical protein [Paraflavitalea soli]AXY75525.1 hypothetical protein D3H65_16745 [Paraflavitalea soli]